MSVYKNIATRFVLPTVNKVLKNRNTISIWNIKHRCKTQTSYTGKLYQNGNSISLQNQIRGIRLTSSTNKIVSFNLSDIGEGIREVVVKEWFIKEGDKVNQFDNICEVQSDKASVTITSRYDGVITKLHHGIDDIALVGKPLFDVDISDDSTESTPTENVASNETAIKEDSEKKHIPKIDNVKENIHQETDISSHGFAIPSVRRLAKENNIKITQIKGTGKNGRVLKDDVLNYLQSKSQSNLQIQEEINIKPVRGYTRAMIKTMTEAMKVPHFVYHDEIRVTNLVKLKQKLKRKSEELNVKITFLPFFIKAASNALSRFPILNSRLDETQENIIYYKSHNIGIAMDTPTGLAVPVIKNVQNLDIIEISKELMRLQDLGKQSKFSKEDLSDGTFSFSNIGAIGGTYAKPIILPPQSAIVALGTFQTVPRYSENDVIIPETIAYFSGAGDHRIIDGATMARFCNVLKNQIEHPEYLLLNI